jgi:MFS family permease
VKVYFLFISAIVIITIGEMIIMPVSQALAAKFAPEHMRGRYMAIFSLAWTVPAMIGPTGAGIIMDNFNPNWVWYLGGIFCTLSVVGFLLLNLAARERLAIQPSETPTAAD